jgi:hypothetical protein
MRMKLLRAVMLATGTLALAGLSTGAEARTHHNTPHLYYFRHHHIATHHFGRYLAARHFHYQHRHFRRIVVAHHPRVRRSVRVHNETTGPGVKPSCFWEAKRDGGPCGCWAGATLLGITQHVWHGINLWLAADWLKFPHVDPAPGTAAVFLSRGGHAYHVAPVKAVSADRRTAILHDSWRTHPVRTAGLIFVQPPVPHQKRNGDMIRYTSGTPL